MKFVVQRVNQAIISCYDMQDKQICKTGIGKGLVVYVWIAKDDINLFDKNKDKYLKIFSLPLFDDNQWRIKLSLKDIDGEMLLVPNFTLYGRNKKGASIDYTYSAPFAQAQKIFNQLYELYNNIYNKVEKWVFGSYMKIDQEVDWPVNFILEI